MFIREVSLIESANTGTINALYNKIILYRCHNVISVHARHIPNNNTASSIQSLSISTGRNG